MSFHEREKLFGLIAARAGRDGGLNRRPCPYPTVNPPGNVYDDCARFLGARLASRGFTVEYLRAEGALGDSDEYPRTNVIARFEGTGKGPCVHFNSHIDVVTRW